MVLTKEDLLAIKTMMDIIIAYHVKQIRKEMREMEDRFQGYTVRLYNDTAKDLEDHVYIDVKDHEKRITRLEKIIQ